MKFDLNLGKKLLTCYIWGITLCGVENWTLENKSDVFEKFFNVVLEKDGENHLERSR